MPRHPALLVLATLIVFENGIPNELHNKLAFAHDEAKLQLDCAKTVLGYILSHASAIISLIKIVLLEAETGTTKLVAGVNGFTWFCAATNVG